MIPVIATACSVFNDKIGAPSSLNTDPADESTTTPVPKQSREPVSESLPAPPETPEPIPEIIILSKRTDTVFTLNGEPVSFRAYEIDNHIFLDIFELSAALSESVMSATNKHFNPRWNDNHDTLYIESGSSFFYDSSGYEYGEAAGEVRDGAVSHISNSNYSPQAIPVVVTVFLDENTINIPAFFITDNIYFALYELSYALDLIIDKNSPENIINIFTNQEVLDIVERRNKIDPSLPMVALTFDDGPGKLTDQFLDVLEKHNVVATFYVIGRQVNSHSETVKRAFDMGNEIANHTWSHVSLEKASAGTIRKQLQDTNNAVEAVTGVKPVNMRPPFGAVNANARNVVKEYDMPLILWSIDPSDYLPRSPANIYNYIMERITDRDIILLHDIHERSLEVTKTLIPSLISKGYQFVTVSELMYFSEIDPEPGKIYRHTRP